MARSDRFSIEPSFGHRDRFMRVIRVMGANCDALWVGCGYLQMGNLFVCLLFVCLFAYLQMGMLVVEEEWEREVSGGGGIPVLKDV